MPKCRICKSQFCKRSMAHVVCSRECAEAWAIVHREKEAKKRDKADRINIKERREKLKSRSQWLAEAQIVFNKCIRLSQSHSPCISCGRTDIKKRNAGHYLSVGSHPHLRFNEDNVHLQCEYCNTYKSGNQAAYRVGLIAKIGIDRVEALEADCGPAKWTIDDIRSIKQSYKALLKKLT